MELAARRTLAVLLLAGAGLVPAMPVRAEEPAPQQPAAETAPASVPAPPAEAPPAYGKRRGKERGSMRWQRDDRTGVAWRPRWELPLQQSASNGRVDAVEAQLAAGADVNEVSKQKLTALHAAVQAGAMPVAVVLLDAGAKVDAADDLGMTPLHVAALSNRLDMVKLLLARGAAPSA
jgi:hypothetical protein